MFLQDFLTVRQCDVFQKFDYFTLEICFLPIFITTSVGTGLAKEWNIIYLVLLISNVSLFASSHLIKCALVLC